MDDEPESDTENIETQLRHRGRRRWLIFGAVALVAVAGAVVALELTGPKEPVKRFLNAALDRDVDDALAEVLPETVENIRAPDGDSRDAFLTAEAMRTDWNYGSVSVDDDVVTAEITGFGKTRTASFNMTETSDGWKIMDPFVYVEIPVTSLTYLDVDGVRVADPSPEVIFPRPAYPLFPGTHRYFGGLPGDVEVGKPGSLKAVLAPETDNEDPRKPRLGELTLGSDLSDQARRQTGEFLEGCAEVDDPLPERDVSTRADRWCPFKLDSQFEIGTESYYAETVDWEITEEPEFEFVDFRAKDDYDAALINGFEAVVTEPGRLTVSGTASGGRAASATVKYRLTCDLDPDGIRGRLNEDDEFAMRFLSEDGAQLVGAKSEDCDFEHSVT